MRKKTILAFTTGIFAILLVSSCTPSHVGIIATTTEIPTVVTSTPTSTPTQTPTSTLQPTIAPTATAIPEKKIDFEKQIFPKDYDDMLAHLENYPESPDPVTQKAEFDKWWNEVYLPALGPLDERAVNIIMSGLGQDGFNIRTMSGGSEVLAPPHLFYFENQGKVYPVLTFNVENKVPGKTTYTMTLILCDVKNRVGTDVIGKIAAGEKIIRLAAMTVRLGVEEIDINKFIDAGIVPVVSINEDKHPPVFGPSIIIFVP
jgi:hypothetical protein